MDIEEKVKEILFELSGEEIKDTEISLTDDLALDSLTMVTLLMGIEDEFLIELEEKDMNPYDLTTVQDCIDLVERYVGDSNEKKG